MIAKHPAEAAKFVSDLERAHWHDRALWFVRQKRDRMAHSVPEWEQLRQSATEIKQYVLTHLDQLLLQFTENAERNGVQVHWARDAAEHNEILLSIIQKHNARRIVKSKSMLTEECQLNPFLERHQLEVIDTDLGEWIVQLRGEHPSHIVMPAIHIKKEEVGETFHKHLGTEQGATDPKYLTEAARQRLRQQFLDAEIGITGVNFAIAETGGFVVCTNEGNADLGVSLPKVHIACMGIEKLIPRVADLGVFLRLLARSATGQPITTYSSHFHGPRDADSEMHIVLVDNGRSDLLGTPEFQNSLKCIRCGACMNTCPVYRRSGGHSYHTTVPGPIGSILAPSRDPKTYSSLPHACSLCGSCTDICPVKIDLHHQLYTWRNKLALKGLLSFDKRWGMKFTSFLMRRPRLFAWFGRIGRWKLRHLPRFMIYNRLLNPWGRQRELPAAPRQSFRQQYQQQRPKPTTPPDSR